MNNLQNKLRMFFKSEYYLSDLFKLIYESNENLNKNDVQFICQSICEGYFKKFDLYIDDNAKLQFIDNSINDFITECDLYISTYQKLKPKEEYFIIRDNVVGLMLSYNENEQKELTKRKPIQINCDNVVLLALFEQLSKEIFVEQRLQYRIAQLMADNFINSRGESISRKTCYDELTEGGGITQNAKNKLKPILERILKRIN